MESASSAVHSMPKSYDIVLQIMKQITPDMNISVVVIRGGYWSPQNGRGESKDWTGWGVHKMDGGRPSAGVTRHRTIILRA